jgi:hypothetical protein
MPEIAESPQTKSPENETSTTEPSTFSGEEAEVPAESSEDNTESVESPPSGNDDSEAAPLNFKTFLDRKNSDDSEPAAPKQEPKAEETQEETEEKPTLSTKPKAKEVIARDYSVFEEGDREIFKNTRNDAFNRIKDIYAENKELKKKVAETPKGTQVYGHPHAYALSPEYQQLSNTVGIASQIEDHWEQQLISVKKGGKWQDADIDPKTGKLVLGPVQDADDMTEFQLGKHLRSAQNQTFRIQQKLENFQNDYSSKYQQSVKKIEGMKEQYFKAFQEDKNIGEAFKKSVAGIQSELPSEFQDHPLADLLAHTGAALMFIAQENKKLKAGTTIKASVKADAAKAPPTKGSFVNTGKKSNGMPSFSDFQKRKEADE